MYIRSCFIDSVCVCVHVCRGLVNVFLGRWQLAKDSFESALQLEPTNLTLRNNVAVCTFYQGHLKEVSAYNNCVVVDYHRLYTYINGLATPRTSYT